MGQAKKVLTRSETSALRRYQELVVGSRSVWFLIRYELSGLIANPIPGAAGLVLRRLFFGRLLGRVGQGTVFGRNLTLRHPRKVRVGRRVVIDDLCVLDGRSEEDCGVEIQDQAMVARNVQIQAKGGHVQIGRGVGVGANSVIHAGHSNRIHIGERAIIAPFTYIGGTLYRFDDLTRPIQDQGTVPRGGVRIGTGAWLGAGATIVDGVTVGRGAVVGAGAVVTRDVPDFGIVGGVPARLLRSRSEGAREGEEHGGDGEPER